jgi:hypothetical protein
VVGVEQGNNRDTQDSKGAGGRSSGKHADLLTGGCQRGNPRDPRAIHGPSTGQSTGGKASNLAGSGGNRGQPTGFRPSFHDTGEKDPGPESGACGVKKRVFPRPRANATHGPTGKANGRPGLGPVDYPWITRGSPWITRGLGAFDHESTSSVVGLCCGPRPRATPLVYPGGGGSSSPGLHPIPGGGMDGVIATCYPPSSPWTLRSEDPR